MQGNIPIPWILWVIEANEMINDIDVTLSCILKNDDGPQIWWQMRHISKLRKRILLWMIYLLTWPQHYQRLERRL